MSNPLIAPVQDSTKSYSGVPLLEDAIGLKDAIERGDWASVAMGAAGTALDALTVALDPFGAVFAAGVGWLIEHVGPLKDALDGLTGNADEIAAQARTWSNVAKELGDVSVELVGLVKADLQGWKGDAADQYRKRADDVSTLLVAAQKGAEGAGSGVKTAGEVVAAVRMLVRDIIAQLVGHLISWALQVVFTLGIGMTWVVPQVVAAVAKTATQITSLMTKLVKALKALIPLLKRAGTLFEDAAKGLKGIKGGKAGAPAKPPKIDGGPKSPEPKDGQGGDSTTAAGDRSSGHGSGSASGHPGTTRGGDPKGDSTSSSSDHTPANGNPPASGTEPSGVGKQPRGGSGRRDIEPESDSDSDSPPKPHWIDFEGSLPTDKPLHERPTVSDPVDISTGEVLLTQSDIDLPGVLRFIFRRTHVSSQRNGLFFGRSWCSAVDQRLIEVGDTIRLVTDEGLILTYHPGVPGEAILPVSGPPRPLRAEPDGSWTVSVPESEQILRFARARRSDGAYLISAITGRAGQAAHIERDDADVPVFVRHDGGYTLRLDSAAGRITALWLQSEAGEADVLVCRYAYDDAQQLSQLINSAGIAIDFRYDPAGRLAGWGGADGTRYDYFYDQAGRCVRTAGSDGYLSALFRYDEASRVHTFTDAVGSNWTYRLDESRNVVSQIDPLGAETGYRYDLAGHLTAIVDPLGAVTRFDYSAEGDLVRETRPDGRNITITYDSNHRPIATTFPDGSTIRREYGGRGELLAVTDQAGARTAFGHTMNGMLASVTDALGATATVVTNAAGLPTSVTDASGRATHYSYDRFGRTATVTDPAGAASHLGWSVEGQLLSLTEAVGTTRWSYTAAGSLQRKTDRAGRLTKIRLGQFGLPLWEEAPDGSRVRYRFDPELRLISVTNQQGMVWTYVRDAAGRTVRETDFDGRTLSYEYDAAGRIVRRVNSEGQAVAFEYDTLSRVVRRRAEGIDASVAYDWAGRVTKAVAGSIEVTFAYDPCGRVIEESTNGRATRFRYDPVGRRTYRRTPSGLESTWSYRPGDLPSALRVGQTEVTFAHDPAGREIVRMLDTGPASVQRWNETNRLQSQTLEYRGTELQRRAYTYRKDRDTPTEIYDSLTGTRRLASDQRGRITAIRGPVAGTSEQYSYDLADNMISAAVAGYPEIAGRWAYEGTKLRQAGDLRYGYDRDGRMVEQREGGADGVVTRLFSWDAEDRMTEVLTRDGHWGYHYDALGRRVAKAKLSPGGQTAEETLFFWDGDVLVEQQNPDGSVTSWDHLPGTGQLVTQTRTAPGKHVGHAVHLVVTDEVGTPVELVSVGGDIAWRNRWTLWGLERATGDVVAPLRFPGQYHDEETGLFYNFYRYYDPRIGQYLSHDPLGLAPGPNSRMYVRNPLLWIDPLGLDPVTHGRPDKTTVFSGHGRRPSNAGDTVTIPPGTTIHFYSGHGQRISDRLGNAIEMGFEHLDPKVSKMSHGSGQAVPNYHLMPPHGLKIYGKPTTISMDTKLSDLLKPNMGDIHWAACRT